MSERDSGQDFLSYCGYVLIAVIIASVCVLATTGTVYVVHLAYEAW